MYQRPFKSLCELSAGLFLVVLIISLAEVDYQKFHLLIYFPNLFVAVYD